MSAHGPVPGPTTDRTGRSADDATSSADAGAGPSIRRRLGIGFAALALLLFGAMAAFEYLAFDRELTRLRAQQLSGTDAVVVHMIEDMRGETDLGGLRHRLDDMRLGHPGIRIWLQSRSGRVLYGSTPVPELLDRTPGLGTLRLADGREVAGISRALPTEIDARFARLIVTIDDGDQAQLRRSLARNLLLALVIGTLVAALLGWWLSRRALRPLEAISIQANAVTAGALDTRLPETGIDVEARDLVASFNRALARLESAFVQQEAFSADVAHELNTPIATLIAGNELALAARADEAAPGRWREQLADNLDELHRLRAIVADMLFLARADRGERARLARPTDLADLAREVLDYHEAAFAEAGLSARVEGRAILPADPSLLKRALSNLLANATRFALPGSTVQVQIQTEGQGVSLMVENDGPTIPASDQARLFDRFYRSDAARSGSDRHHGLGLAIVAAIARMHGGHPCAHSENGQTAIGLWVPAGAQPGRVGCERSVRRPSDS